MTKHEKELLKRIDTLEKKVKEMEARPAMVYHYHHYQPAYPDSYQLPQPTWGVPYYPIVTSGGVVSGQTTELMAWNAAS